MPESLLSITRSRGGFLLGLACFVVVIAGLKAAQSIVLQALIALFVAVAIAPPIFYLQRKGLPFALALSIVVAAVLGVFAFVAGVVGSSINDFTDQAPFYEARLRAMAGDLSAWVADFGLDLQLGEIMAEVVDPGQAFGLAANFFAGLGGVLANSLIIVIMTIFLLLEASTFETKLQAIFANRDSAVRGFRQMGASINRYLVIKTWVSLATGALAGVWCAILGVDYALLWGMLAFLLNYVPNIGSIIAALPPALLAVIQIGPGAALLVFVGFAILNNVLGNIVEPRFMGEGLGLSTFAVVLSLVFWGWVLGPVGMLLSIPLTMAVKIAMEDSEETRWLAILLGTGQNAEEVVRAKLDQSAERKALAREV